jgi:predicted DNA-binding antitoxin AbrB/MazE fold protein
MGLTIEAVYENGVLWPLQALPLSLNAHERVQVTIHAPEPDLVQAYGLALLQKALLRLG